MIYGQDDACNCEDYFEWECASDCFASDDNPFNVSPNTLPAWTKCPCNQGEFVLTEICDYCKSKQRQSNDKPNTLDN